MELSAGSSPLEQPPARKAGSATGQVDSAGTTGVSAQPRDSDLILLATEFLSRGPARATELIAHVCRQSGTPQAVAEHMAAALLAKHDRFRRGSDGLWELVSNGSAVPSVRTSSSKPSGGNTNLALDAPESRDLLHRLSYVVVDVETTGGRAQVDDRIMEIAAVRVVDGEIADVWESLVNPGRAIPPWITRLTNISWDMVADKPTFAEVCEEVLEVLQGHVFVAHNVGFDWGFVTAEVERASGMSLGGRRLCTVRLARRLLPQLPRRSLDWVARHYGVEIDARHRAAGDAIATAKVLQHMLNDAAERGVESWGQLEQLLSGTQRRRKRRSSGLPRAVDCDSTA